jgi:hypothetical protein
MSGRQFFGAYFMKTKLLGLMVCMALLSSLGPAFAVTVFDVSGTFTNPPSLGLSGTLAIDTALGTVTDSNLTVTGYTSPQNIFTGVPDSAYAADPLSSEFFVSFTNPSISILVLGIVTSEIPGSLVGFTGGFIGFGQFFDLSVGASYRFLGTISPTPLPAALPLFATGLGALGLLGWRRKRKAAAIAAA